MKKTITILIVTHNSLPFLRVAINSIKNADTKVGFKILVVDNGSDNLTRDYLEREQISFLRNETNIGYIEAQAQAFQKVDTQYLCSCNDDIVVTSFWLDKLLDKIRFNPKIKIVAPVKWGSRTKYPYNPSLSSREVWEKVKKDNFGKPTDPRVLVKEFTKEKSLDVFANDFRNINQLKDVVVASPPDFVAGFCFLTETNVWKELGGFVDPDMKIYGTEDVERCWRLGLAGYEIVRTADVYVHHFEGASINKNNIDTSSMLLKNNRILLKKYRKYFWSWLTGELKKKTIEEVIKDHWIVEKLLINCQKTNIPDNIISAWARYEKSNL